MAETVVAKEYDYYERKRVINTLCEKYKFLKHSIIGKSCSGKGIDILKIGSGENYAILVAGVHGSERITSTLLLMFVEELCCAIKRGTYMGEIDVFKALRGRGVIFLPCLNPDGCDISLLGKKACGENAPKIESLCRGDFEHWNANLRGVDLNHNFDAGWEELHKMERELGIIGPAPTRFGGYKPHSEPETVALAELCMRENIRSTMALHSQGEVIYWDYGTKTPAKSRKMAEILATSSGYALDVPISIATGGGFKDWFIDKFRRPGFTVEVGVGKNPLPPETAEGIYRQIKEMLSLYIIM